MARNAVQQMKKARKPPVEHAMRQLIAAIRQAIPLNKTQAEICRDDCNSCSLKLLEFLNAELDNWEYRLQQGERPGLAELSRLERTARKIHRALVKNKVL